MRFNRPELSIVPEEGQGVAYAEEEMLPERVQAIMRSLERTAVPTALYMALIFGGSHVEAYAQQQSKKVSPRPAPTKPAATRLPEKKNALESLAKSEEEVHFIRSFGFTSEQELQDFRWLVEKIGIPALRELDTRKQAELNVDKKTHFTNFEKANVPPERVEWAMHNALPAGWLKNVKSIEYKDELIPMGTEYGEKVAGTKDSPKYEGAHANPKTLEIVMSKGMQGASLRTFRRVGVHETAHVNFALTNYPDAASAPSKHDCFELMVKVVQRIDAPNRYKREYVESISTGSTTFTNFKKMQEYWACIMEARADGEALPVDDENIIDWWVGFRDYKKSLDEFLQQEQKWNPPVVSGNPVRPPSVFKQEREVPVREAREPIILPVRRRNVKP